MVHLRILINLISEFKLFSIASILTIEMSCLDCHRRRGAVQLGADHSHNARALRLRLHGGQRGNLRHLPQELGHRHAVLQKSQQAHRTGVVFVA